MHGVWQILLVGKNEKERVLHLTVVDDAVQLLSGLINSGLVCRVNNKDKTLSAGEVMAPKRSNLLLPTDVPNVEPNVFVCKSFDIKANCGNC